MWGAGKLDGRWHYCLVRVGNEESGPLRWDENAFPEKLPDISHFRSLLVLGWLLAGFCRSKVLSRRKFTATGLVMQFILKDVSHSPHTNARERSHTKLHDEHVQCWRGQGFICKKCIFSLVLSSATILARLLFFYNSVERKSQELLIGLASIVISFKMHSNIFCLFYLFQAFNLAPFNKLWLQTYHHLKIIII
jgi:hypothetical protein